jgi:hypothetical protein
LRFLVPTVPKTGSFGFISADKVAVSLQSLAALLTAGVDTISIGCAVEKIVMDENCFRLHD